MQRALIEDRGIYIKSVEIVVRRKLCGAASEWLVLPGVLQAAKKKRKAAAAMRETDPQARRQAIERAADDQGHERELRFRGHADGPGHHVFGMRCAAIMSQG